MAGWRGCGSRTGRRVSKLNEVKHRSLLLVSYSNFVSFYLSVPVLVRSLCVFLFVAPSRSRSPRVCRGRLERVLYLSPCPFPPLLHIVTSYRPLPFRYHLRLPSPRHVYLLIYLPVSRYARPFAVSLLQYSPLRRVFFNAVYQPASLYPLRRQSIHDVVARFENVVFQERSLLSSTRGFHGGAGREEGVSHEGRFEEEPLCNSTSVSAEALLPLQFRGIFGTFIANYFCIRETMHRK